MGAKNLRTTCSAILLGWCLAAASPARVTLRDYARGRVPTVYTVAEGANIPLGPRDQTNNFKNGFKVLTLSGKNLTSLEGIASLRVMDGGRETALADVPRLHLFLNDNALGSLPDELFAMQNVAWLYLNDNRLGAIPPGVAKMKNLLGMYFTANNIYSIPPEVFTMTWLRKLQVSKNHLTQLPADIGNLTELIHFNISDNAIEVLPDSIARLTKLRVCDFSDNKIKRLPEAFGQVRIMHQLRVCNNPMTTLPAGFAGMPGSIDITGTQIRPESLPPALRANIGREKR